MDEEIFANIKTKDSGELFEHELELLLKSLYEGKEDDFNSVLQTKVRAFISNFIREKYSQGNLEIEDYLKDLLKKTQELPKLKLILAFEPSEEAIDRFYSLAAAACGKHILLDISFDPSLIGGAVIIYKGEYRDFSFKKIFEKEFGDEQENILKLLAK
ncbi:F0F1 ATP synthase subunit delta [Patescibacteria group bacterium]|nr:F0F1 ATP synthase subunit delta [Patescibacteria group bacterium]